VEAAGAKGEADNQQQAGAADLTVTNVGGGETA
jgi:hypothetical protein